MKVIWFNGNLGNQIFYCAFIKRLKEKFPDEKIYGYFKTPTPITVHKYFQLEIPEEKWYINVLSFLMFRVFGVLFRRVPAWLVPWFYCRKNMLRWGATFFDGYWQDHKIYEDFTSDWVKFRLPESYSEEYLSYERKIMNTNSVCIHVRRGDYVKPGSDYFDLSSTDYYKVAISKALEMQPDATLFFFSDDIAWVRENMKYENAYYVDCNTGKNSYLDIVLMTKAKMNIIANSTFSYWGAYIGNENKTVFCPKNWFVASTGRTRPDIMLKNWIEI